MTGACAVVIALGNPYRRDDGIGPAVAADIEGRNLPCVRVVLSDGEPVGLIEAWAGAELAIVVDSWQREPSAPGRIHRFTPDELDRGGAAASSHGFDLSLTPGWAPGFPNGSQRPCQLPCRRSCANCGL
jgi:hydrogenase maturation protease